jgi:hypothetical protein
MLAPARSKWGPGSWVCHAAHTTIPDAHPSGSRCPRQNTPDAASYTHISQEYCACRVPNSTVVIPYRNTQSPSLYSQHQPSAAAYLCPVVGHGCCSRPDSTKSAQKSTQAQQIRDGFTSLPAQLTTRRSCTSVTNLHGENQPSELALCASS